MTARGQALYWVLGNTLPTCINRANGNTSPTYGEIRMQFYRHISLTRCLTHLRRSKKEAVFPSSYRKLQMGPFKGKCRTDSLCAPEGQPCVRRKWRDRTPLAFSPVRVAQELTCLLFGQFRLYSTCTSNKLQQQRRQTLQNHVPKLRFSLHNFSFLKSELNFINIFIVVICLRLGDDMLALLR